MARSKTRKILSFAVMSIVGLAIGVAVSFYVLVKLSVPSTGGTIKTMGVEHPVEITFDKMGICQIWAESETDAYFALGYQHAADRMFQMDLSRRIAKGRLSQMLGDITRDIDIFQRRIGHYRSAAKALTTLSEENRARLGAYTDGVNAYKTHAKALPFEYRFLPVTFEDWTIEDCLALLSFQTWFSNALMNRDEFYIELEQKIGHDRAQSLVFPYPDWAPTTVPDDTRLGMHSPDSRPSIYRAFGSILKRSEHTYQSGGYTSVYEPFQRAVAGELFRNFEIPMQMTHSSNAWVVAPPKSASGHAMLASDPHLELTRLPQFWYVAGVHASADSLDVLGVTTPGLPFFVMGHNGRAAWAFTAGGIDVIDYREIEVNPSNADEYRDGDQWVKFETIADSIVYSDSDKIDSLSFKTCRYGIVVDDIGDRGTTYAFHWAGFDTDMNQAVSSGFELHSVRGFDRFRRVVTNLGALDANMHYADINGNIGYQLTTPVPIRDENSDGWNGYLDLDATPHAFNPSRGWLASCNNLPERGDNIRGHFFTNRILSIFELLGSKDKFTVDDMRAFQSDINDRYWLRFTDDAARILDLMDQPAIADSVREWDGYCGLQSRQAAILNVYRARLKTITFTDELGGLASQVPDRWIECIAQVDSAGWFDDVSTDSVIESYDNIAMAAMKEALKVTDGKVWGQMQSLEMQHPLSMIPVLSGLMGLTIGPEPWPGSPGTLRASFYRQAADDKFETMAGPSWRFVVDFADVDAAQMVLPAGNSGNPMSDHFRDFYPLWRANEYWTVPFTRDKVTASSASILNLEPEA
ncbi:MAG: penicillin acylase family protein [Candidatus Zixiibacteriota bacterium]